MKLKRLILFSIVFAGVLLAGCDKTPETGNTKQLILYCGAGIRPVAEDLISTFEVEYGVKVAVDFAGSEVLLSKIRLTHQGDLYMPGDKYYVDQATAEDMVYTQKSVCYWIPTILVRKGNPKNIQTINDLLKDGVKLGLGDAALCAIGKITRKVLEKNNIAWADVEKNLKFHSQTVNELGMQIQAGSLDAVIVWDAMARYYSRYGEQVAIPPEKNEISTVDIGVLSFSKNKPLAEKFVDFAASEQGQAIFRKHNYTTEAPNL